MTEAIPKKKISIIFKNGCGTSLNNINALSNAGVDVIQMMGSSVTAFCPQSLIPKLKEKFNFIEKVNV